MENKALYFVTTNNCHDYVRAAIELASRHKIDELIEFNCAADEQIKELESLAEKLEKAFNMASLAYQNCELFCNQTGLDHVLPYYCYRVQVAYLVASRSFASYEGIILALLAPAVVKYTLTSKIKRISIDEIRLDFGETCVPLFDRFPEHPKSEEDIDQIIYEYCAENIFASIKSEIEKHHGVVNIAIVEKAYNFAKGAHSHVARKSGEAYILHPLYVALLLAQNGLDCDVISAALIHDVVEDARSKIPIDQIESAFNSTIASYVDAVTSVDSERYPHDAIAYHSYEKSHDDRDEETYQKLKSAVETSPEMVGALYIKAADRIHNLLTLDTIAEKKLYAKIDQTEDSYLELFKKYHLNRFVHIIESECLRYHNPEKYHKLEHDYSQLLNNSRAELGGYSFHDDKSGRAKHFTGFHEAIEEHVAQFNNYAYFKKMLDNPVAFKVEYKAIPYYPSEIAEQLREYTPDSALYTDEIVISKRNILLEKFYVILSSPQGDRNLNNFIRFFMMNYRNGLAEKGYIIIKLYHDDTFNQYHFYIVDPYFNTIDVIVTMKADYIESLYGSFYLDHVMPTPSFKPQDFSEKITAKTPDGKKIELAPGSTVLDFAYYVHAELCLEAYEGIVNGNRRALHAKLSNGDEVYVCKAPNERKETRKKETKTFTPRATPRYLRYTKNVDVQRYIINYLSQQIYGDDITFEDVVGNDAFHEHLDNMFNVNSAIMNIQEEDTA